jgi:hypothetical protein
LKNARILDIIRLVSSSELQLLKESFLVRAVAGGMDEVVITWEALLLSPAPSSTAGSALPTRTSNELGITVALFFNSSVIELTEACFDFCVGAAEGESLLLELLESLPVRCSFSKSSQLPMKPLSLLCCLLREAESSEAGINRNSGCGVLQPSSSSVVELSS